MVLTQTIHVNKYLISRIFGSLQIAHPLRNTPTRLASDNRVEF